MYLVNPREGDLYFLRLLLVNVKGATSFRDLRIFNGIVYLSFREAAEARGLLHSSQHYITTLQEGHAMQPGAALRRLFVGLLLYCEVPNPLGLWEMFRTELCSDFIYAEQKAWSQS